MPRPPAAWRSDDRPAVTSRLPWRANGRAGVSAPLLWLGAGLVAGVAAYLVGWPVYRGYRRREWRDLNTERYLAWRGRARPRRAGTREGLTGVERRRLWIAGALGVLAVVCLVGFFAS
jgi:hypothetical protein